MSLVPRARGKEGRMQEIAGGGGGDSEFGDWEAGGWACLAAACL